MSFLHPWAIYLGVAAAALPVVVHLLTRPRPVAFPLSTLRFVRQAISQRRARHRLRDFLVLLLRTAAVVLAALALARPWWGQKPMAADSGSSDATRVVLLDVSESMGQMHGGIEMFERARATASDHLRFRQKLQAGLILAGAKATSPTTAASTNFEMLRDELAAAKVQPVRLNVKPALEKAAAMLAPTSENDARGRELVIVSDFQRGNWAAADFSCLPKDTEIRFESVAPAKGPANLAILRVGVRGRATPGRTTRLEAEVGNFSEAPRNVQIAVRLGQASYTLSGACPAGRTTVLASDVQFNEVGWLAGEAKLVDVDDALAADNVRPVVVQVRPKPTYAIITRQPAAKRPSSSHYLECALAPDSTSGESASAKIIRLDPDKLDLETLAPVDLIALEHPGKLSDSAVELLSSLMRRGRPIVYVTAETVDATNLHRLQQSAGRGMQLPVEFQPATAARRELFLTNVVRNEMPFQTFGDNVTAVTGRLRFSGGLASRQLDQGLRSDVLGTLNDGSALLVHSYSDAGQLAVFNADLEQSNLRSQYAMVLLFDALVQRMLGGEQTPRMFRCGETLQAQLPIDAGQSVELKLTADRQSTGEKTNAAASDAYGSLKDEATGAMWTWGSPTPPGVYRASRGENTVFALAVEPPGEEESRLESLPQDVLTARLASGRNVVYRSAIGGEHREADNSWATLLTACALCLIGEFAVLSMFRS